MADRYRLQSDTGVLVLQGGTGNLLIPSSTAQLATTGLVARYFLDEAASGTTPTQALDASGVMPSFTLDINYGSGNMAYAEVSGNRGLDSTTTTGTQRARKTLVTGDKVITAFSGTQKAVLEIVARVDNIGASFPRGLALNDRVGGTEKLGLGLSGSNWEWIWNGTASGVVVATSASRDVLQLVFDTTQATQNDRVRYKLNGGTLTQLSNTIALNDTLTGIDNTLDLIFGNRENSGSWDRCFDGIIFYGAFYAGASIPSDAQLTDNATVLADDDTPAGYVSVTPTTAALTLTLFAPTITVSDHQSVTPGTLALTLSTFAPTITVSDHQTVTPGLAALTLSTFAPTVATTNHQTVTPPIATLTISTFAPVVTASDHQTVLPGVASLTISTFAPTITVSDHQLVTPSTATLTLSTFAPTVSVGGNQVVTPGLASLTLSTFAPILTVSNHQTVFPEVATLTLSTFAPSVALSEHQLVTPETATLTLTMFAPTVTGDVVSPPLPSPVVIGGGGGGNYGWRTVRGGTKKRNRTYELFASIEQTMRETLDPPPFVVAQVDAPPGPDAADTREALAELAQLAKGHHDLQARLNQLRFDLVAYAEDVERAREEDDEECFILMA